MSRDNTQRYYSLIESLIVDQKQIWGTQAIKIANSVPGLHISDPISDPDDIWVNGHEKEIAGALAEAYIEKFGQAAESSLRDIAQEYQHDVDLPSSLQF